MVTQTGEPAVEKMKRSFESGAQKRHSKRKKSELNAKLIKMTSIFRPSGVGGCTEETGIVQFAIANITVPRSVRGPNIVHSKSLICITTTFW